MGQLIVRNLDDEVIAALKARAASSGRSAEAEHRRILEGVLLNRGASWRDKARRLRERIGAPSDRTVDLIREDRARER